MQYIRSYIEACEGFGWSGGPEFNTRIVTLANGRERRNADWPQHRHRYTLPFNNIDMDAYRSIRQMFEVVRGQAGVFLYKDPLSNYADNQLFGFGDGSTTEFQLTTLSSLDGVIYQRQVNALPDGETLLVTVDGVSEPDFTVDRDRGKVIFDTAPAVATELRWSGNFVVWVRFNNDWLPMSIDSRRAGGVAINGTIDLIEVPSPEEVSS